MASGDTRTNNYLDIAANGTRADLPTDTCCETRTQTLIRGVAERIIDVEDEVEEMKNNPDVVDIVATYADLQNYDTSTLTDKDVIRVLIDETHGGNSTFYRWDATDEEFTLIGEVEPGQGVAFIELTPTQVGENEILTTPSLDVAEIYALEQEGKIVVARLTVPQQVGDFLPGEYYFMPSWINPTNYWGVGVSALNDENILQYNYIQTETVSGIEIRRLQKKLTIEQTTGSSTTSIMSQNAVTSMVFADPVDKEQIQIGSGATNSLGPGVAIGLNSKSSAVSAVSIGVNAGSSSTSATHALSLGTSAVAGQKGSIALGSFSGGSSAITAPGMIHVGTDSTSYGYNSSNYRLLTGLYDPQSDHDAATKGYVDGKVLTNSGVPTTATVGTVGQLYQDTTNGKLYICTVAASSPASYTWELVGTNALVIREWS